MVRRIVVEYEGAAAYANREPLPVTSNQQTRAVAGALFADSRPRLVEINGIQEEAGFARDVLYVANPGAVEPPTPRFSGAPLASLGA